MVDMGMLHGHWVKSGGHWYITCRAPKATGHECVVNSRSGSRTYVILGAEYASQIDGRYMYRYQCILRHDRSGETGHEQHHEQNAEMPAAPPLKIDQWREREHPEAVVLPEWKPGAKAR